jgi:replicative DNA helicase
MNAPDGLLPPFDLAAEKGLIGCLFRLPSSLERVADWLPSDDCYLEKHGHIYAAIRAVSGRGEPVDYITVGAELEARGLLAAVGGYSYLAELTATVPHAAHIERYGRIVQQTAILRRLIEAGGEVAALGYEGRGRPLDDVLADAEKALQQAGAAHAPRETATSLRDAASELMRQLELAQGRDGLTGVATGYRDLDNHTGGLQASDLIILAARPSLGKTALALSLAYNIAKPTNADGGPVGVFSLEMSVSQLTQRLLAMHTGLDLQRLRTGNLSADELHRAMRGIGELSEVPIHIDDTAGLSIADLQRRARRMHAKHGLAVLVVDYLQLMSGAKSENRVQEVSEISRGLKVLARELDIPVLALSQLSRAVEARQSKIPLLSDLRESGSLEQDADIVAFIYREEVYDKETDKQGLAELHIAKHRNGPPGVIPLRFDAHTTRFQTLDRYRSAPGYDDGDAYDRAAD